MSRWLVISLLLGVGACGGEGEDACEPLYQGGATDEAWRTMLDAIDRATQGGAQAPAFTAPAEGQVMASGDAPPLIAWSSPLAKPHLPPVTGDVYLVELRRAGMECPVNLLTTELSWQLDAASWAALTAGGAADVEVTLTGAYLSDGRITEGPFQPAAPRTFKIQ
jgi:hypothetical protein